MVDEEEFEAHTEFLTKRKLTQEELEIAFSFVEKNMLDIGIVLKEIERGKSSVKYLCGEAELIVYNEKSSFGPSLIFGYNEERNPDPLKISGIHTFTWLLYLVRELSRKISNSVEIGRMVGEHRDFELPTGINFKDGKLMEFRTRYQTTWDGRFPPYREIHFLRPDCGSDYIGSHQMDNLLNYSHTWDTCTMEGRNEKLRFRDFDKLWEKVKGDQFFPPRVRMLRLMVEDDLLSLEELDHLYSLWVAGQKDYLDHLTFEIYEEKEE